MAGGKSAEPLQRKAEVTRYLLVLCTSLHFNLRQVCPVTCPNPSKYSSTVESVPATSSSRLQNVFTTIHGLNLSSSQTRSYMFKEVSFYGKMARRCTLHFLTLSIFKTTHSKLRVQRN